MASQPGSSHAHNSSAEKAGNTLRDRILLLPDGYIGSVEKRTQKLWVCEGGFMTQREVTYVPGLLKIFDEILVYAADNKQRDPTMDTLRVDVDVAKGRICVYYNGEGIPIEVNQDEGVYVPEMIFGHLSNCDHDLKITSGGSGYGVKLANIFSTEFVVETANAPCQKKYKQVFSENMGKRSPPEITGYRKGLNWTMVTFRPDLAKFSMTRLEDDVVALIRKRVFDMASILGVTVQVVFNGQKMFLPRGFPEYVFRHIKPTSNDSSDERPWICEKINDQWQVGVSLSEGQFEQVSFVNKIATTSGGTHVDYVSNLIASHFVSFMNKNFGQANVTEHDVKRHLMVFVNVLVENPTFDSPTREALTIPPESFGSECELSDLFYEKVHGCRLLARLLPRHAGRTKRRLLEA